MHKLIKFVGREKAITFYKEVVRIQAEGGEINEQFRGNRTPGGVFIGLIKKAEDLNKTQLKILIKADKTEKKHNKKLKVGHRSEEDMEEQKDDQEIYD